MTGISDKPAMPGLRSIVLPLAEQIEPDDVGTTLHHFLAGALARES
jgi:hypothetical protein